MHDFKDLAQRLKRCREEQGLTLDELIHRTKLNRRTLEALESGDALELPHPVYVKGFIKAYLAVLNLDIDQVLPDADAVLGLSREEQAMRVKSTRKLPNVQPYKFEFPSSRKLQQIGAVVALVLLGLGALIWYSIDEEDPPVDEVARVDATPNATPLPLDPDPLAEPLRDALRAIGDASHLPRPTAPEPPRPANASLSGAAAPANATAVAPAVVPANVTAANASATRPANASLAAAPNATGATAPRPANATAVQPPPANASSPLAAVNSTTMLGDQTAASGKPQVDLKSPAGGAQSLVVKAREQSGVTVILDNETAKDFYLYPGQSAVIRFQETITIRLSNAGAMQFVWNGKDFPNRFEPGVVKTLTFPPAR